MLEISPIMLEISGCSCAQLLSVLALVAKVASDNGFSDAVVITGVTS